MKNAARIFYYIVKNNKWHEIPKRLLYALFYQFFKRITNSISTKMLFNGKQIFLFPQNPISSSFIYTAFPDKQEILSLRDYADANTVFLDIGANIGAYSILLLDKVKAVYAFEAHPITANYCKLNFLLNGVDPSQVIVKAVSENQEDKYLSNATHGSPTNTLVPQGEESICVPSISLDQFIRCQAFGQDTNFIVKIDVEGFEYEVFKGAREFLKKTTLRAILFETFSAKNEEILIELTQLGYQVKRMVGHNILAFRA